MVFEDLSAFESQYKKVARPPVQERFLAFCFDLFILLPFATSISLIAIKPLGELGENLQLIVLLGVGGFVWIWFNAFLLAVWGTTPGKSLLKMKVVSSRDLSSRPHWDQALLRSIVWLLELVYFGIPMLGVFRNFQRRPFHDRIAKTMVVSRKKDFDFEPSSEEKSWSWIAAIAGNGFLAVWMGTIAIVVLPKVSVVWVDRMPASTSPEPAVGCAAISDGEREGVHRMQQAIFMYQGHLIDRTCLEDEIESQMDDGEPLDRAWASLAMAFLEPKDEKQVREYLDEVCRLIPNNEEPCLAAQDFFNPKDRDRHFEALNSDFPEIQEYQSIQDTAVSGHIGEALKTFEDKKQNWPDNLEAKMNSWMCLAQITNQCSTEAIPACEQVSEHIKVGRLKNEDWDLEESIGWVEYQKCQRVARGSIEDWRNLGEERADVYQYAKALLSALNGEVSQGPLLEIVRNEKLPSLLRARALSQLNLEIQKNGNRLDVDLEKDFQALSELDSRLRIKTDNQERMPASVEAQEEE